MPESLSSREFRTATAFLSFLSKPCFCLNCGPRGRTGEAKPGSTRLRGPEVLGPLNSAPRNSVTRFLGNRGPGKALRASGEALQGPRRGVILVCPFSKERGKKVGHSEAPKRPRFPGCPLRGFQPSGSYPQATDNLPKRGCFDENSKNDEFTFYALKARASLLRPPKTTKMAGVTQAKAWF